MNLPSIIYVCGQDFNSANFGQLKRLDIVSQFLAEKYPDHPRYLLAPVRPLSDAKLAGTGWQWVPVAGSVRWPRWRGRIWRAWTAWIWRVGGRRPAEMLSIIGGVQLRFPASEEGFFSTRPGALVLVGRCDLTGMVRYRQPGQHWALDSNDSVTNLEAVCRLGDHWRRFTLSTRESWLARVRAAEQKFALRYDRIICISRDDERFFAAIAPGKVCLEDTDVVLPSRLSESATRFDVGFIGAHHAGSVKSARNLMALAALSGMQGLHFGIAGRVCDELGSLPLPANVKLVGRVDDSLAFLRRCKCVVIFTGPETGASVKFQESLAAGCIVIANQYAARYSLARAGETHLEANTLAEVARLLSSGEVWKFSPRSLAEHFSRAAFHQRFAAALGWSGHD